MDGELNTTLRQGRASLAPDRAFLGISALLFLASAAATIYWARSMSGAMTMAGDAAPATLWSSMPGQPWPAAAAAFLGMWLVMMVAMMLPALVYMLAGYRRVLRQSGRARLAWATALAGAGYFFVWALVGAIAYPFGASLAAAEMQSMDLARLAPVATGAALLLAGIFQLTAWKAHQLVYCHYAPGSPGWQSPWRHGFFLGLHCCLCCLGFMLVLFVTGVMNLAVMAVVAAAITVERLTAQPKPVTRALGSIILVAGLAVIVRALRLA